MATVGGQGQQQQQRFGPELAQAQFAGRQQQPQPISPNVSVGGGLPGSGGGFVGGGGNNNATAIAQGALGGAQAVASSITEKKREKRQLEQQKQVIDYSAKTQAKVSAAADNFTRWMNQRETLAAKNEVAFEDNVRAWREDLAYRASNGMPIDMNYEMQKFKSYEQLLIPNPAQQLEQFDRSANEYGVDQPDEFGFSDQVTKKREGLLKNQAAYGAAQAQLAGPPADGVQPVGSGGGRYATFYEGQPLHELRAAQRFEALGSAVMTQMSAAQTAHERKAIHTELKKTHLKNAKALEDSQKAVDAIVQQATGVDSEMALNAGKSESALMGSKTDVVVGQWLKEVGKSDAVLQIKHLMTMPYSPERERKIAEIETGIAKDAFKRFFAGVDPNDAPGSNGEKYFKHFQTRSKDLHPADAKIGGSIAKIFADHIAIRTETALADRESWLFSNEAEKDAMRRILLGTVAHLRKGYVGGLTKSETELGMQDRMMKLVEFGDNLPPEMWGEAKDIIHEYGRYFESALQLPPGFDSATGIIDVSPIVGEMGPVLEPFIAKYPEYVNPLNQNFDTMGFEDYYYRQLQAGTLPIGNYEPGQMSLPPWNPNGQSPPAPTQVAPPQVPERYSPQNRQGEDMSKLPGDPFPEPWDPNLE